MNSAVLQSLRLPFLILTPVTVWLAAALALHQGASFRVVDLTLVLVAALLAHIAVNTLNEYQDFVSGLDLHTQRTPFSGGSGGLPGQPGAARGVLLVAVLSLLAVVAIGLWLIAQRGAEILPLGLAGVVLILAYTRWINRHPLLCLIAPGLGFGPFMVMGSYWVLVGEFHWSAALVSVVPFLLANNLLLLNQYPDIEADAAHGRRTLPIVYGLVPSNRVYLAGAGLSALLLVTGVRQGLWPVWSLIALLPLALVIPVVSRLRQYRGEIAVLLPALAMNVAIALLTPALFGLGLALG